MKMVANREQIAWIGWLLHDEKGNGFLSGFIEADVNRGRLKGVWDRKPYDERTQSMLNYLIDEFHKDYESRLQYRRWLVTQPF